MAGYHIELEYANGMARRVGTFLSRHEARRHMAKMGYVADGRIIARLSVVQVAFWSDEDNPEQSAAA